MRTRFMISLALCLFITAPAFAATLSLGDKLALNAACGKELKPLCGQVPQGEGRMMQCITDNQEKLSSQCLATIDKLKEKLKQPATPAAP